MGVRFGTDGIRGAVGSEIGPQLLRAIGRAAAVAVPAPRFLVARDTRRSGPMLQAALSEGLAAEGVDVVDLGVLPTPGLAFTAAARGLPGAVVSASHNPYSDNGVKLFAAGGRKLSDAEEAVVEARLEAALRQPPPDAATTGATGPARGRHSSDPGAADAYADHLVEMLEGRSLAGTTVVVDCAHGAASAVAPAVLRRLGAEVTAVAAEPNGTNINAGCGSTHPERVAAEVVSRRAQVGLALDGDADRLVAVDHTGAVVGGDELLVLFAADLAARGRLAGDTVVVTVMSNLGLRRALAERGIAVVETPVGDRYVLEALEAGGHSLGGEQSGHLVFRDLATTGDGLLTGILLLDLLRRTGRALAELAGEAMTRLPQVLLNVAAPAAAARDDDVRAAVAATAAELGDRGRVLLRPSGTEPVVRVMIEAEDEELARRLAAALAAVVARAAAVSSAP